MNAGEQLVEIGGKPSPVRQRREEPFGQHRIKKPGALRQLLGQARRPSHDFGNEGQ